MQSWAPDTEAASAPNFGVVIPARYGSTRLPGKPLRTIAGKPMILHVLESARRSGAQFVWVATDDVRIAEVVSEAGGTPVMTSGEHASGTDRVAEVVASQALAAESIVVNLQGDEPLMPPGLLARVALNLHERVDAGIATLATPIKGEEDFLDHHSVKVVLARDGRALYFSRTPIPHGTNRKVSPLLHVGLYAYRVGTLLRMAECGPVELERAESLEQLRALWLGIPIHVDVIAKLPGRGVDTEGDLSRVAEELERPNAHEVCLG